MVTSGREIRRSFCLASKASINQPAKTTKTSVAQAQKIVTGVMANMHILKIGITLNQASSAVFTATVTQALKKIKLQYSDALIETHTI
ncbi:MAG TPA: hypothetical protein DCF43_07320 [Pseudomonas sp.]|nr:hypothetical protein [Pseudomonas sp.]